MRLTTSGPKDVAKIILCFAIDFSANAERNAASGKAQVHKTVIMRSHRTTESNTLQDTHNRDWQREGLLRIKFVIYGTPFLQFEYIFK